MTSQPRDKTRDSTKHDTAKFGIDLYSIMSIKRTLLKTAQHPPQIERGPCETI